ncbi:eukaryotic translation initiation factor 4E [Coemansia sp. Benny D115]|nr:eukaryotic translation initiation factor 4E [Coemansia sp. Benny D115]
MTDTQADAAGSTQAIQTVLADPKDFNAVHPLNTAWTLWFDNQNKKSSVLNWTDNLKEVVTMNTVEDYWGVYNNVALASDLPSGSNYHLFRKGIVPMWEDAANAKGGKWGHQFQRSIGEKVNEHWLHILLACIGEAFESSPDVCGVVFSNRKSCFRIAIWTRNASDEEACRNIGRYFKNILGLKQSVDYMSHKDATKSNPQALYTV